jgi:hypothetical protein
MEVIQPVYFKFEEDFVEDGVRCIPMIVRLKLDLCGVKLKLQEWSKFSSAERTSLASDDCFSEEQRLRYRQSLQQLIVDRTGHSATTLEVSPQPEWTIDNHIPKVLEDKLQEFSWQLSVDQWRGLTPLQRFALLKLSRPSHENRNFPRAFREFGLAG